MRVCLKILLYSVLLDYDDDFDFDIDGAEFNSAKRRKLLHYHLARKPIYNIYLSFERFNHE